MSSKESILRPVKHLFGGTRLPHLKGTAQMETVAFSPDRVLIPLCQHIGAPCTPQVKKDDKVFVGTLIGDSDAFVSAPIHSSVSGKVTDIITKNFNGNDIQYIEIESDQAFENDPAIAPFEVTDAKSLAEAAKRCGLVGLGGAGFPTHIKLTPPKDKTIDTLIVNAAECEPYITSDYRECIESGQDVIDGIFLLCDILKLKKVVICVESNKPKAIEKLYSIAASSRDSDDKIKLMKLPTSYPQGAEKMIIYSATGRKLPLGKLPSDIGCIVMNITSIGTLYRFIKTGMPLTAKRITLEGNAVNNPQNILVPIGTKISDIIDFAGGADKNADRVITGGAMMGFPVADIDAVVEKRTNAVLVMKSKRPPASTPCIKCGRCAAACPMRLYPARVDAANRCNNEAVYESLNVNYCMECGSCSYVCPAKRPLTQVMRVAKATLRRKK